MAFENIDVSSLKNAIISCKNSLNHSTSQNLISQISESGIWQSDSQKKLINALEKLNNVRYKELETKLNNYLGMVSLIEEHQTLEKENKNLDTQYSSLKDKLYYTEHYTTSSTDSEGNIIKERHTRTVKDYSVERRMNENRAKRSDNRSRAGTLKNKVVSSI